MNSHDRVPIMSGYLIYHPARTVSHFSGVPVYHDSLRGNQDPYVWNSAFLHTYCHITQMSPAIGDINFWASGDCFPSFNHLYCDLVFVVAKKVYWQTANSITLDDPIVESDAAYADHYCWGNSQHRLTRRRRFTLKADAAKSFQPQGSDGHLIDLVPFLASLGLSLSTLRQGLRAGFNSKPLRIDQHSEGLYTWLCETAAIKLTGATLETIHKHNWQLLSPMLMERAGCSSESCS